MQGIGEAFYKPEGSNLWKITRYEKMEATIKIESLNFNIKMSDLYFDIEGLNK